MTTKDIAKRLTDIDTLLLKLTEKKPSTIQKFWHFIKPFIIPFILGVIVGFCVGTSGEWRVVSNSLLTTHHSPLTEQAAQGGAAIPFPSDSFSPSPSISPPGNSKTEQTDTSSMSTSEPVLPVNRPADAGQTTLPRLLNPRAR
jgi:hypothetical protein